MEDVQKVVMLNKLPEPKPVGAGCHRATGSGRGSRREQGMAQLFRSAKSRFMKIQTISAVVAATFLLVGCGKQNTSSGTPPAPVKAQPTAASGAPVAQAALSAWQQGDQSTAVNSFLAADWSARPLFPTNSVLSLTEDQLKSLSDADRQARLGEIDKQLYSLLQLAGAVSRAGHDAASKGDTAQAQKYYTSVKQCGTALNSPDCSKRVQVAGVQLTMAADTAIAAEAASKRARLSGAHSDPPAK